MAWVKPLLYALELKRHYLQGRSLGSGTLLPHGERADDGKLAPPRHARADDKMAYGYYAWRYRSGKGA